MQYLVQPRGPGSGWVFRMVTPPELIGVPNPWDGKPLGKEIKKGLSTRHPTEARKRRDVALGDVRRLRKFASVHASDQNHFNQERNLYSRQNFKLNRAAALAEWRGLLAAIGPSPRPLGRAPFV